ncbi:MAG: SIS domain-containing protein [Acidisphaera sp.]|nr:SIS domain-containing protein [Acidisphaera sp.]
MERSAALKRRVAGEVAETLLAVVDACESSLRSGGKLMFCGNGGSAADSQHLATELLVRLRPKVERNAWPALALTLDPALLTAGGNDYGFERVFERPLRGLGRAGDVLFGITTSGRSPNVIRALQAAREMGIVTVGLLGGSGEPARAACDLALLVPDEETTRIQECHITLGHAVVELLEDRLIARPI